MRIKICFTKYMETKQLFRILIGCLLISSLLFEISCGKNNSTDTNCHVKFTRTEDDQTADLRKSSGGSDYFFGMAQPFKTGSATNSDTGKVEVSTISLRLQRVGEFPSSSQKIITLRVLETALISGISESAWDANKVDNGEATVLVKNISTTEGYQSFSFDTALELEPDTTYYLVLSGDYDISAENYVLWTGYKDELDQGNGYSDGVANTMKKDDAVWSFDDKGSDFDFNFKIGC